MVLFNMEQWVFISEAGGSKITDFWDFDTRHLNEHLMPSHIYIYICFSFTGRVYLSQIHILLQLLTETLRKEEKESLTRENVLVALQKLSLRYK